MYDASLMHQKYATQQPHSSFSSSWVETNAPYGKAKYLQQINLDVSILIASIPYVVLGEMKLSGLHEIDHRTSTIKTSPIMELMELKDYQMLPLLLVASYLCLLEQPSTLLL